MKGFFRKVRQDRIIFGGIIFTYIFIILSLTFIFINYNILPPYIPLFNQLPWGQERLAPELLIFIPVVFAIGVNIINTIFSLVIYSKSQIIARMLSVASSLISLLAFLFLLRTILIIT